MSSRPRSFVEDLIYYGCSVETDENREAYYKAEMKKKVIPLPVAGPWAAEIRFQREMVGEYYAALHRPERPETTKTAIMQQPHSGKDVRTHAERSGKHMTRIDVMNEYAFFLTLCQEKLGNDDRQR